MAYLIVIGGALIVAAAAILAIGATLDEDRWSSWKRYVTRSQRRWPIPREMHSEGCGATIMHFKVGDDWQCPWCLHLTGPAPPRPVQPEASSRPSPAPSSDTRQPSLASR